MEIKIRPLQEQDVEELALIQAESFSDPWSANALRELLKKDYCKYLVALSKEHVIGGCGYTRSFEEADVDNVVVAPDFRNQGVASMLMEELLQQGIADGITAFTLEVRVSNTPAIRLYEKYGFTGEGIRPRFYDKPKEDAMIMWYRI